MALMVAAFWLPRAIERYEVTRLEQQLADEARLVRRLVGPLVPGTGPALRAPAPRPPGDRPRTTLWSPHPQAGTRRSGSPPAWPR